MPMITRVFVTGVLGSALSVALLCGCGKLPADPLTLEGNMLTVENRSGREWIGVEVWLNTYYRVTAPSIPAGGRFQAPLDTFVESFGRRFDFRHTPVTDLRLNAKRSDGTPVELKKQFEVGGLAGALGRKP